MGRDLENARRTANPRFGIRLRNPSVLEKLPLAYVPCITEVTRSPATTVSHILTEVLDLRFRYWRSVSHPQSDNQKADRARQALLLLGALSRTEKRRWVNFWTCDGPWTRVPGKRGQRDRPSQKSTQRLKRRSL
jgi:hypothetical protein